MVMKEVGEVDVIQGTEGGVTYNLLAMKEPDYIMKMMAKSGSPISDDSCRSTTR
jgi:hypothetical protein